MSGTSMSVCGAVLLLLLSGAKASAQVESIPNGPSSSRPIAPPGNVLLQQEGKALLAEGLGLQRRFSALGAERDRIKLEKLRIDRLAKRPGPLDDVPSAELRRLYRNLNSRIDTYNVQRQQLVDDWNDWMRRIDTFKRRVSGG